MKIRLDDGTQLHVSVQYREVSSCKLWGTVKCQRCNRPGCPHEFWVERGFCFTCGGDEGKRGYPNGSPCFQVVLEVRQ